MELKNRTLSNFAELVESGECKKFRGRLKVGVDLGTANTVLAVVDTNNRPIAGISAPSHAIQDGVIVNYYESVQLVTRLKAELEERLGVELPYAAAAIPPGVSEGSVKSIGYVLEGAGFEVTNIVDEPTAAGCCAEDHRWSCCRCRWRYNRHQHPQRWQSYLHRRRSHRRQPYDYDRCRTLPHPIRRSRSPQDHSGKRRRNLPGHQSRNRKNGYDHREISPRISGSGGLRRWWFRKLSRIHHCIRKETWSSGLPPGSSASRNTTRHRILLRPATGNT